MNRNNIKDIIKKLDELCNSNYQEFEVALMIWLRSDLFTFNNYITDGQLEDVRKTLKSYDSILNVDLKIDVDNILND